VGHCFKLCNLNAYITFNLNAMINYRHRIQQFCKGAKLTLQNLLFRYLIVQNIWTIILNTFNENYFETFIMRVCNKEKLFFPW